MQNKGLIKVFAILFGLVCIYQLSFTFITNNVESEAEDFARQKISENVENYSALRDVEQQNYLDSVGNNEIVAGITYSDAKDKELNKGLDLKGGINVILQISVKDILAGLANNTDDPAFNQAIAEADEASTDSQDDYVDLFFEAFNNIPDAKLASPDVFANKTLSDEINFEMSNDEVETVIRRKVDESITSAFEVLRKRIDKFGVTQPNIQRLGNSGRILVELPGAKDINRVQGLLQSTAQLEFWHVYKNNELGNFLAQANNVLKDVVGEETEVQADTTAAESDSDIDELLAESEESTDEVSTGNNPLFELVEGPGFQGGPVLAYFSVQDTAKVNKYLSMPQVRSLLPAEQRYAKFAWGIPEEEGVVGLYALKGNRNMEPPLSGDVITDAQQTYDQMGRVAVSMQMDGRGAKLWEEMTGLASTQQSNIAIVLDNTVYSAPGVSTGPISGGRSEISGDFTITEGQDLANVLRAGKLPASADIIQSEIVGPSLGQEAIDSGIWSFAIALVFVLLWMIFYYGKAGLFADVALAVNILFIFGILAGLGAVLTLPGIAGIVLTIGISVDANVLIFERIREELAKGKVQKDAIKDGFNNALSSILDANITTGLTGFILLILGTGPIKGFATTLLIGIATSLFTAIFITRLFIDGYGKNGKSLDFATGATKNLFRNVKIDWLGKRKMAYIISGILIIISIGSIIVQGLNPGVDFVGGRTYTVRFDQDVNPTDVEQDLIAEFGSAEAKTFGPNNQLKITTKYKVDEESTAVDNEIQQSMFNALQSYLPQDLTFDEFTTGGAEREIGIMQSMKVGPTIADDIKNDSFWAILGSLVVIFLYILLRFRKWQFSIGAVAAVAHDVIIVLGVFSLLYKVMPFSMEINQAFIAAILTVIGYSLNDTVVVFDRIREFVNEHTSWPLGKTVNVALDSTISRTLNTSLTTLIVLLAIFIFGGESIRGFMFALIIGVIVGTYSSLFIATPVMFDSVTDKSKIEKKKKIEEDSEATTA
ncbi:protein translocase subunit SecDF [Salegentibacter mishustinae]|uniref:Multifunctional fusion protein n=1 Tax=Salegentibacter mishustinae TaxID=270918 RepID=A0A0Q9ZFV8_9FLAO|nr:protein translocase subunit SecDF [Salegentibacter mishustinae]KRG28490.1 preprotein translocase subunit SecD [Salegentibacter mishustinae]PNW22425.1 preprotein translocase subunit SecD [Salegentibacter mishustinae]PZX67663.1 SecD/SecF fusion protein [Salegentibacter mishustinae]GGW78217.1 protein translocase subunit SecDF [Salegentibacter mishustinae]